MPSLIAIDLGTHAVKVVALRRTGRTYELEDQVTQAVPQDAEGPPDLDARLAALDLLLEDNPGWQTPGAEKVLVWSGASSVFRRLRLPFTDRAQIAQTLPFTVEGEVPHDLDEMVMAHRVANVEAGSGSDVCVLLTPEQHLDEVLSELKARTLNPSRVWVDADILAAVGPRRERGIVAVIDVGHTHTVVSIVVNGQMELCRSIDVAGRELTLALAGATGQSYADAEVTKHSTKPETWSAAARDAVNQAAALLLAEVRAFLITAEDRLGLEVEEVRLGGGGARYAALPGFLQSDLGVPVRWVLSPESGDAIPNEHAAAQAAAWCAAGVASTKPMDLRVGDLAYRGGRDLLKTGALFLALAVVFLTIASLGIFVVRYTQMGSELSETEDRILAIVTDTFPDAENVSQTTAVSIMTEKVFAAQDRAKVLGAGGGEPPTLELLYQLHEKRPSHTQVEINADLITISPKMVTMKAETVDYTSASTTEETYQKFARFKKAEKSDERKTRDKIEFTISVPLDDVAAGDEESN